MAVQTREPTSLDSKYQLALFVMMGVLNNFEMVHLSGNLKDTMYIETRGQSIALHIPAERYDIKKYLNEGVVVYTGDGSYACEVNVSGGFSGWHRNYLERSLEGAIFQWIEWVGLKAEKVEVDIS